MSARKIALGIAIAATIAVCVGCATSGRRGLFNSAIDDAEAFAEHEAAWREQRLPRRISRHQMLALVRRYDGRCITADVNWETVPLDRRLDDVLSPNPRLIECVVITRSWPLLSLPRAWFWTTVLRPVSSDEMDVVAFRRQQETL